MTLGLSAAAEDGPREGSGELPVGWARATIAELCDVNPRGFDEEPDDEDFVSQVPMAAVEAGTGRIDASTQVRYGDIKKKSLTRFQENDVLFAKITPCMENGKIAKAQGLVGGRALGSTEFHVLRSRGAVLPEYLMHYLLQRSVRIIAEQHMSGAVGQRRVPRPYLESLEIPVPPLPEQVRIVAEIEQQVSRIEAGEASVRSAEEVARSLWLAVLESIVESGSASSGWQREIAEVATVSGGIQKSGKRRPSVNAYPFLRVANVSRGALNLSDIHEIELFEGEIDRYKLTFGDLLVVEGNGSPDHIGRGSIWRDEISDCVHQNHLIRVRPGGGLSPDYLELVWNAPSTSKQLKEVAHSTSGLYTLSTAKIKKIKLPVPALSVQAELVKQARSHRGMIDAAAVTVVEASHRAQDLRASLLHAAFTGALAPQDPADEPASVTLDRIRAVHGAKSPRKRAARKPRPTPPGQEELPS
ncbi:restriction endonuclease subunit S [Streptomyces tendae]|uniref:restriction endonuclease subunit S n=1 Tax=Streptomyces tendae TaxID=1932 RepID=UPI00378A20B8